MRIVVKVGGHAFPSKIEFRQITSYAKTLKKLKKMGHKIVAVTGGGKNARKYIEIARKLKATEGVCDLLGIEVSRINARLLIICLGDEAYPEPVRSIEELKKVFEIGKIIVLGGLQPGQSTNSVASLSAEAIKADLFINATDVDGVYTADPKTDKTAKKMNEITTDALLKLVIKEKLLAGGYSLFDPVAVKIIERSKIPTRIIDGRQPENIERVVKGEALGTLIRTT